jgi:hypothetical protein
MTNEEVLRGLVALGEEAKRLLQLGGEGGPPVPAPAQTAAAPAANLHAFGAGQAVTAADELEAMSGRVVPQGAHGTVAATAPDFVRVNFGRLGVVVMTAAEATAGLSAGAAYAEDDDEFEDELDDDFDDDEDDLDDDDRGGPTGFAG